MMTTDTKSLTDRSGSERESLGMLSCGEAGQVLVATVECEAVREHQSALLRAQLGTLAERSRGQLVVSLERISTLSAGFLYDLAAVADRCRELGGRLVVFGAGPVVRHVMDVARLANSRGGPLLVAAGRDQAISVCMGGQDAAQEDEERNFLARLLRGRAA